MSRKPQPIVPGSAVPGSVNPSSSTSGSWKRRLMEEPAPSLSTQRNNNVSMHHATNSNRPVKRRAVGDNGSSPRGGQELRPLSLHRGSSNVVPKEEDQLSVDGSAPPENPRPPVESVSFQRDGSHDHPEQAHLDPLAASKGNLANQHGVSDSDGFRDEPQSATNADQRTSQDYYFDSYAHHAIHEEMLKDHVRTQTYQMAITQNAHLFRDKIVLDVGCGTGILSLFCAQVGARHVYAVDCSAILEQAQQIVDRNGYSDKITLIKGKVEEINLPVDKVDIIVSEWMGYFLLYESMLDTVIFARDKWLVPNGIVFPDKAVMYLTAMEDENVKRERIDFWDDVYGFDMTPIKEIALREPVVDVVDPKALVTNAVPILHLDILTCTREDLAFSADFRLQAQRNDFIHGLVAYFECAFTQIHKPIGFSTAPFCRYTHWKQTMFYVRDPITICAGETLQGQISCQPNPRNKRDLDISVSLQFHGKYSDVDTLTHYRLR